MDFSSTIVGVIVDHTWDPIRRRFGYLISYKRHIVKLESKFNDLDALRKHVQGKVDAARRERLEEVDGIVQAWLTNVNSMEGEVKRIKDKEVSVISNNCFLNINLHYKLGREAANHTETTDDLIKKGNFDSVSHKRPPPSTTDSLLFNQDYKIFDSRKSNENKILKALEDEAVNIIGLWGMGGGGKTTLVKEIAKQAKERALFGEVVMVTISQNIDLKITQTVIAESLGLVLTEDSVEVRAVKLADRLTATEKKVLVILDDLWETLDLSKVGIRLPQMGMTCKVVITTRNRDVCERMCCQVIVELKMLSDEESWSLFRSRAGDAVESPTMMELARKVARECAGLPLALVVLGTALKGKSIEIWKAVLMRLKRSQEVDLPGVSKQVFQSIQLSFDFLESEAAKSCFLHCCLYPEDCDIFKKELMPMIAGGGLLADVETLNEAENRVDLLLDQLKACGLLLQGSYEGRVRMHDVVRDVAMRIGAKDHAFYVRAGLGLEEWPRTTEGEMRNCRRLSLMRNSIRELPPGPVQYPKLETLILRDNRRLSSIPEMFFQHMGSLMVLDLSGTRIESLPKSLSCLTDLRVLNLRDCSYLKDISHINGLKMLETLILYKAPVSIVPEGAEWAQNLRFVDLGFHSLHLSAVDDYFSKELARFGRLEQLFMNKFSGSFGELISLRHLTHLFIQGAVHLDHDSSPDHGLDRLLEFNICLVDKPRDHWYESKYRRGLKLIGSMSLVVWVKRLLEKTIELVLEEFQETELVSINSNIPWLALRSSLESLIVFNWRNLTKLFGDELLLHEQNPLTQLKKIIIGICPRLTSLIPSSLWRSMQKHVEMETVAILADPFPALENLYIINCQEMSEIISPRASLQAPCFFKGLTRLSITFCGRLAHLFSYEQAIGMQHLSALSIEGCDALEAVVISTENKEEASASTSTHVVDHESYSLFPNLTRLTLRRLPQLTAFHHPAALPIDWLYLQFSSIKECPNLQHPLFGPRTRAHDQTGYRWW